MLRHSGVSGPPLVASRVCVASLGGHVPRWRLGPPSLGLRSRIFGVVYGEQGLGLEGGRGVNPQGLGSMGCGAVRV